MDYQQIKDSLTPKVLSQYFKNLEEIPGAINTFIEKHNNYQHTNISQPFNANNIKRKLSFLCSNYPGFIASILILGKTESDHIISDLSKISATDNFDWKNLNIQTIANAESIVKNAQKSIQTLLSKDSITAKDINQVLIEIEPLSGAEPFNDIRRIYWMMYCEFRVTLQFIKPEPKWDFFFTIGNQPKDWFNIRGIKDVPALKYLNEHTIEEYGDDSNEFSNGLITSVKNGCVSDNGSDESSSKEEDEKKENNANSPKTVKKADSKKTTSRKEFNIKDITEIVFYENTKNVSYRIKTDEIIRVSYDAPKFWLFWYLAKEYESKNKDRSWLQFPEEHLKDINEIWKKWHKVQFIDHLTGIISDHFDSPNLPMVKSKNELNKLICSWDDSLLEHLDTLPGYNHKSWVIDIKGNNRRNIKSELLKHLKEHFHNKKFLFETVKPSIRNRVSIFKINNTLDFKISFKK